MHRLGECELTLTSEPILPVSLRNGAIPSAIADYFGHGELPLEFAHEQTLASPAGYFSFGPNVLCYGRLSSGYVSREPEDELHDVAGDISIESSTIRLPFDPVDVMTNLRYERYASAARRAPGILHKSIRNTYYLVRPLLTVSVRKHLQKFHLNGWRSLPFPNWPVDCTVDRFLQQLLIMALRLSGLREIPFIWFWPDGASACAIMTHDVESELGRDRCAGLMEIDASFGIPSSFQIVPERRYRVSPEFLNSITRVGFELNVQDLDHRGGLFRDRSEFERRVGRINEYGRHWQAGGFRSAILYRNPDWYHLLNFEYDMSIPNVAHLDPQRGGCCTVMPFFIGNMVELPVTTTQDYSLFHILGDYSLDLWKQQIKLIREQHGIISFIVHPDYLIGSRVRNLYKSLLNLLAEMRAEQNVWIAHPGEVNRWWRQRRELTLHRSHGKWSIQGPAKERARIAFARFEGDRLVYDFSPSD